MNLPYTLWSLLVQAYSIWWPRCYALIYSFMIENKMIELDSNLLKTVSLGGRRAETHTVSYG